MQRLWASALWLLLLIGCSSADPDPDPGPDHGPDPGPDPDPDPGPDLRPRVVRSGVCEEHTDLHGRMDAIEKTVDAAVQRMEEELVDLLDTIEDAQWRPPVDSSVTVDVLADPQE